MKKILAIALALVMVLGIAATAGAASWAQPAASGSASPFKIEVIKLGVNADVTGAKYYTVVTDAAAFQQSNLYYAIKLTLPGVADLNNFYGNSKFKVGDQVKVVISYTNIVNKSSETVWVTLGGASKTLWFNGKTFDESWTASLQSNCGCGNNHILSAVASDTAKAAVKACIGATGKLSDIKIDGCYNVKKKSFLGIKPCKKCNYQDLSGFLFYGDCAAYDVFFSTNSAGKVTGIYALDHWEEEDQYAGSMMPFAGDLYGWTPTDTYTPCYGGNCNSGIKFDLAMLGNEYIMIDETENWMWNNATVTALSDAFMRFIADRQVPGNVMDNAVDQDTVYFKKDGKFYPVNGGTASGNDWFDDLFNGAAFAPFYAKSKNMYTGSATTEDAWVKKLGTYYKYTGEGPIVKLYDWYFFKAQNADSMGNDMTSTDATLHKMMSADYVECDYNEAAYRSSINHVLGLLGFTYADVAAGTIYMTEDIILANFGFATGAICDEKVWGAYTAAITVASVAEVPATGSVSYVGFAMIVLAIAAAVVTRKVRA